MQINKPDSEEGEAGIEEVIEGIRGLGCSLIYI